MTAGSMFVTLCLAPTSGVMKDYKQKASSIMWPDQIYNLAANGWVLSNDVFTKWFGNDLFVHLAYTNCVRSVPEIDQSHWAFGATTPQDIDKKWEEYQRSKLPVWNPVCWCGDDKFGQWYHPLGFRLSQTSDGFWNVYKCPNTLISSDNSETSSEAKTECKIYAVQNNIARAY